MSTSHRAFFLAVLAFVTLGCTAETQPPLPSEHQAALIADQVHGSGAPGFFWLPPLVTDWPRMTDPFAAGVAPTVAIDRNALGFFTRVATLSGADVRELTDCLPGPFIPPVCPYYAAAWSAARVRAGEQYRVRVLVGTRELGLVDVQVVATREEASRVDRRRFAPLVVGDSLPIPFRINAGDSDGDGVVDWRDNCPTRENPDQLDSDRDGKGDRCECDGVVCTAQDPCHAAGTCNPRTGTCSNPLTVDPSACIVGGGQSLTPWIGSEGKGSEIALTSSSPPCIRGHVSAQSDWSGYAVVGVGLDQSLGLPPGTAWAPDGAGLLVEVDNPQHLAGRAQIQLQGPAGYPAEFWCASLPAFDWPVFIPWESFNSVCWNNSGSFYARQPLVGVGVSVLGDQVETPFDLCVNKLGIQGMPPAPATYYVATDGEDLGPGTLVAPFRTIQRCASVAGPGDRCLVRSGIYRETVTPGQSGKPGLPITFEAYPGEEVTVSGADVLELGWQPFRDAVYVAETPRRFIQLFANGKMVNEARWPNAKADDLVHMPLARAAAATTTTLQDPNLPEVDLGGAYVFTIPGERWRSYTRPISSHDRGAKTIAWQDPLPLEHPSLAPRARDTYYVFGALDLLDEPGEWFLDPSAGKLYFWAPGSVSPAALEIEVKQRDYAFDLRERAYIEVRGLRLFASSIWMNNSSHCVVDGVRARYVSHLRETEGYATVSTAPTLHGEFNEWKNGTIAYSAADGIIASGHDGKIQNNLIHDTGYMGVGGGGIWLAGWDSSQRRNEATQNTLCLSGGMGITAQSADSRVLHNRVFRAMELLDDGGLIYSWGPAGASTGTGTEVAYNHVSHISAIYGTGIYLDCGAEGFVVHHNLIHEVSYWGIILKNPNQVFNNTIWWTPLGAAWEAPNDYQGEQWPWGDLSSAVFSNNLIQERLGVHFSVQQQQAQPCDIAHPAACADYEAIVPVIPVTELPETLGWQKVVVSFSELRQPNWGDRKNLDLAHVLGFKWEIGTLGSYGIEIEDVTLENSQTSAKLGVGEYLHSNGTKTARSYAAVDIKLLADASSLDVSAYDQVSFRIRGTATLWLSNGTSSTEPQQNHNAECPVDADLHPTTSCAIDQGQQFPPYTDRFLGAGPDIGAFEAGASPWKAGSTVIDDEPRCGL